MSLLTRLISVRGTPKKSKSKQMKVDPDQFDVEENLERHLPSW
jgi:hypothetical protein